MSEHDLSERARALRAELDESFARPRPPEPPTTTELLAFRIGARPYALLFSEVRALVTHRPIVRLPTPLPELLGLCAIRGVVAPVYDLGMLLGVCEDRGPTPRWLVLAHHQAPIALAFDTLDGQARVPTAAIAVPASAEGEAGAVFVHGVQRPLIRIAPVLAAIEERVRPLQEP